MRFAVNVAKLFVDFSLFAFGALVRALDGKIDVIVHIRHGNTDYFAFRRERPGLSPGQAVSVAIDGIERKFKIDVIVGNDIYLELPADAARAVIDGLARTIGWYGVAIADRKEEDMHSKARSA